jgi:hypothetical protein
MWFPGVGLAALKFTVKLIEHKYYAIAKRWFRALWLTD